jgi:SAM-dependent methyltransferase
MANNDKDSRDYWGNVAENIKSPLEAKNKRPDTSDVELDFLKKIIKSGSSVLDMGCGSGLITNKLLPITKDIIAVDKFEGFTKFVDEKITVINAELLGFKIRNFFDVVLCTGVGQCFVKAEMQEIYANIFDMLEDSGVFISRMHCGIKEEVSVNSYSEELKTDYFAEFRQVDSEKKMLLDLGFESVEVHDFLPDTINVWDNTRHYYFVCKKSKS